jgi:hypothetical protein
VKDIFKRGAQWLATAGVMVVDAVRADIRVYATIGGGFFVAGLVVGMIVGGVIF